MTMCFVHVLSTINLTSDHFAVLCDLDVRRPVQQPEYRSVRNIRAIDLIAFRHDVATLAAASSVPSADQLCDHLRSVLDKHAPAAQRKVPQRRSTPWYSAVAPDLRALKQKKRQAERQWLRSGLAVHKEIFCSFKHKINRLVDTAKTKYFNAKICASTTCGQLFSITKILLNKTRCTTLPSSPVSLLPQMFCDFFLCPRCPTFEATLTCLPVQVTRLSMTQYPLVVLPSFISARLRLVRSLRPSAV